MNAPATIPEYLSDALRHVELVTGQVNTPVCFRFLHDQNRTKQGQKVFGIVSNLCLFIKTAQANGYGVFFVVNEGGDTDKEITRIRACFIDADNVPLPDSWHLKPDFIVKRDETHWHAYWRVDDLPVDEFHGVQKRLAAHYRTDPAVCNPSRVMRLAGTLHQKGGATRIVLHDMTDGQEPCLLGHTAAEIVAGLPEVPACDDHAPSQASGDPTDLTTLCEALSYIDPTFSGGDGTWVGIGKAILHGQLPVSEEVDWTELLDAWCSGSLWRERTGDESFVVPTYGGNDELLARLSDAPRDEGKTVGLGTISKLATDAGWRGSFVPQPSPPDTQQIFGHLIAAAERDKSERPKNKFRVLLPKDMRELPPPSWLITSILPANAVVMCFGAPASFKTFIALEIALGIATGKSIGWGTVAQGAVAYCAGEAPVGIARKRFPAWAQQRGISDPDGIPFALVPAVPLVSTTDDVEALIEALSGTGLRFSLIVLDTVARALGGLDENSAKDAGLLLAASEKLRDTFDCSVLLIHHTGKDENRGARGSSALLAGVDAAFEVRAEAEVLVVTLRCEKMKDADPPPPIRLQGTRAYGSIVFDPIRETDFAALTRSNTSVHQADVTAALKTLKAVNGATVTTQVLATELAGDNPLSEVVESKKRALQRNAKDRLRAYVTRPGEGRGASTLWSLPAPDIDGRLQ